MSYDAKADVKSMLGKGFRIKKWCECEVVERLWSLYGFCYTCGLDVRQMKSKKKEVLYLGNKRFCK